MKLSMLNESVDARIYHVAHIWPGSFVVIGAISMRDARDAGLVAGELTSDTTDGGIASLATAMKTPHPQFVDMILELPDEPWIAALRHQSEQLRPNIEFQNVKIVDRAFDGTNMMLLKYVADVNLREFYKSNDWSASDAAAMVASNNFKIIKKLP